MKAKEIEKKLSDMEKMISDIHAWVMTGGTAEIKPGSYAIKHAAREMLKGNDKPMHNLGGRKFSPAKIQGGTA